jgi:hypothetical protein
MYVTWYYFPQRGAVYRCNQSLDCGLHLSLMVFVTGQSHCLATDFVLQNNKWRTTSTVFRVVTLNRESHVFRSKHRFHPQAHLATCFCRFLGWLILIPWKRIKYIDSKYRTVSELQADATQKTRTPPSHFREVIKSNNKWQIIMHIFM